MLNRSIPPDFVKDFSFELPEPTISILDNGIRFIQTSSSLEVIKLDFVFTANKWVEPKAGVSYFTTHTLEKGTKSYTAQQIAQVIDYYGAQLEFSAGPDYTSVSIYSLSTKLAYILPVVIEILQYPNFPPQELSLLLDIFRENLLVNNEKTAYLASKQLKKNIFGDTHPYGRSIEAEDLTNITTSDLFHFFSTYFTPHQVYLTGNLSEGNMLQLQQLLNTFKKNQHTPVFDTSFKSISTSSSPHLIKKEESIQTSLRIGRKLFTRTHPDYAAFLLLIHLLGGFFGSRLMKNIREKKGLTYGIYASLTHF